jgi:hypothetical protein
VYISASVILGRHYDNNEFQDMLKTYSTKTTNFWPYLRQREKEVAVAKSSFVKTFVGKYFWPTNPICDDIWRSGNNDKLAMASRYDTFSSEESARSRLLPDS